MPRDREGVRIGGVRITSPDRVLFEGQGTTKRALAEYYLAVAERMLPHLRGRPLTLVRCPSGTEKQCFYQRNAGDSFPEAVRRVEIPGDEGETSTYLTVDGRAALLTMVQMGVLELHTWGSRRDRLERPDRIVLDLDPDPVLPWDAVVEAALAFRERLAELGLTGFVKTTGGKGLHVVVPITRTLTWDELRDFCRGLAEEAVRRDPARYLERASKQERTGKIFVDYLRNARSASAVAAYSTRARAGAPVSTPVTWHELERGVDPREMTIATVPARSGTDDPWVGYETARARITRDMLRTVRA